MFTEDQVLEIVDSCFHAYASDYRHDAKEMAEELMAKKCVTDKDDWVYTIGGNDATR